MAVLFTSIYSFLSALSLRIYIPTAIYYLFLPFWDSYIPKVYPQRPKP